MQKARWSTAIAAAALLALPGAAFAQSTPQSTSPQNPPTQQSQPPTSQPATPAQPPATPQQPAATAEQPAGQVDAEAAKAHLSEARNALSQMASLPEAAKLQGNARTQISQLISDFNALITTQADWRSAYAKVDSDMSTLLGPDANDHAVGTSGTGAAGATGTTGTAGAPGSPAAASAPEAGNAQIDPAIRAKLVEFRTHLKAFEKAAGGAEAPAGAPANEASSSAPAGSMPPSAATSSTSNPSNPAASPDPAASSSSPSPAGSASASSPTASMSDAQREQAAGQVNAASNADAQKELDAISSILSGSKTGALTKAQTTQLKKHVENLRALLAHQGH